MKPWSTFWSAGPWRGDADVSQRFSGRAVLPGNLEGEAVVSHAGFNAYASFYDSLHDGATEAVCADSGNKEVFGKRLDGKIVCLPKTTGSTSAGAVWTRLAKLRIAPKAVLFSQQIDPLAAGGLIAVDQWGGMRIVTIDQLGDAFLQAVKSGDRLSIQEDGTVLID